MKEIKEIAYGTLSQGYQVEMKFLRRERKYQIYIYYCAIKINTLKGEDFKLQKSF